MTHATTNRQSDCWGVARSNRILVVRKGTRKGRVVIRPEKERARWCLATQGKGELPLGETSNQDCTTAERVELERAYELISECP